MLVTETILANHPVETADRGTVLMRRTVASESVIFVESGRVVLGVLGSGRARGTLERQLGVVEGPGWLEASTSVLHVPSAVDAVAQTEVRLRRLPLDEFKAGLANCSAGVRSVVMDIARANLQKAELAVSRMAKDAEARCAEWLLRHAKSNPQGSLLVQLQLNKRAIAAELGIVPETMSRILTRLRDLGLISGTGRLVTLLDPAGLRSVAGLAAADQA